MKTALETLGYHPYHMSECIKHWPDQHLHYWDEALKAKYRGQGKPYQVAEFNKIFKDYDVRLLRTSLIPKANYAL